MVYDKGSTEQIIGHRRPGLGVWVWGCVGVGVGELLARGHTSPVKDALLSDHLRFDISALEPLKLKDT